MKLCISSDGMIWMTTMLDQGARTGKMDTWREALHKYQSGWNDMNGRHAHDA